MYEIGYFTPTQLLSITIEQLRRPVISRGTFTLYTSLASTANDGCGATRCRTKCHSCYPHLETPETIDAGRRRSRRSRPFDLPEMETCDGTRGVRRLGDFALLVRIKIHKYEMVPALETPHMRTSSDISYFFFLEQLLSSKYPFIHHVYLHHHL